MAVSIGNGNGRASSRYRPMADINVTPLVDVMLVLLVVFMVTAPLLTVGVPVDLPQTQAPPINEPKEPTVTFITRSMRCCRLARMIAVPSSPLAALRRHSRIAAENTAVIGSGGRWPTRS